MTFLKKILLIDSDPRVRDALTATGKYLIKEEHDSRCAMSAVRWFQPNLILCEQTARQSASSLARDLQQDAACCDIPLMFVRASQTEDDCVSSGGMFSGYSFVANAMRLEEFVRGVGELLVAAD